MNRVRRRLLRVTVVGWLWLVAVVFALALVGAHFA
jgi:hypothetical protein